MSEAHTGQFLPALMGSLRQEAQNGVLVLEQSDGTRYLYWVNGNLVYLKSEVAGEQFGNYLIRRGVLDWDALQELLADSSGVRFGDRLVKWGLLNEKERDDHLYTLMRQILLNAMEHPIVEMKWNDASLGGDLDLDLYFPLDYRRMVWETFQELATLSDVCDLFKSSTDWRWEAPPELLDSLKDLPLTPQMAYVLTFLGKDPMGFETLVSLTGMEEVETARLIVTLWALSGLNLAKGEMPSPVKHRKPTQPITPPMVPILQPVTAASASNPAVVPPVRQPDPAPKIEMAPPPEKTIRLEFDAPAPAAQAPIMEPAIGQDQAESSASEDPQETISPEQNALKVYKRAKYLLLQDRTSETVRLLEESVKLDPEGAVAYDSWLLLGRLRMANPAWSVRAMDALQSANKLRPKAGEPYALMGELYHRKGFKREAAQNYRRAIELNPLLPIPQEVDMTALEETPEEAPKPKPSFWQHLKAWWDPTSGS
ncbi:MAG: tetratricopeptide repeat protein [Acidobacteriota bacterium]|nr:tetratricopeptide repeat protein [Acidobacteriota bacterium]